jgi:hypothetical protein
MDGKCHGSNVIMADWIRKLKEPCSSNEKKYLKLLMTQSNDKPQVMLVVLPYP